MEKAMHVQPYLLFKGRAEEALEFIRAHRGAEITMVMRFKESPETPPAGSVSQDWGDKVMHSNFHIGDTQTDGIRRLLRWTFELSGLCALPCGRESSRG